MKIVSANYVDYFSKGLPSVVCFDQQTGALHAIRSSKSFVFELNGWRNGDRNQSHGNLWNVEDWGLQQGNKRIWQRNILPRSRPAVGCQPLLRVTPKCWETPFYDFFKIFFNGNWQKKLFKRQKNFDQRSGAPVC